MIGAIVGDIIGSAYEWDRTKDYDFQLLSSKSRFTDDTVMTIACADAVLHGKPFETAYKEWGNKYPRAGYGGMFRKWLQGSIKGPYGSFGNGSAMRVSPIGWAIPWQGGDSLSAIYSKAEESAACSHNHPDGIKGAQAVAASIFLVGRCGFTHEGLRQLISTVFKYDLSKKLDDIRPGYKFDSTCPGSVPESIIAYIESKDFIDAIRLSVSLGGDADTTGCITGAIAQAEYGVPENLVKAAKDRLPVEIWNIVPEFHKKYNIPL